jgi:ethanolamine transporter EutH
MADKDNLTDISYGFVEEIERRKRYLELLIIGGLILAPVGLVANGIAFVSYSHQKGFFDFNMTVTAINILLCCLFVIIGINQYALLKRWRRDVKELEMLEERIFEEVLRPK